MALPTYAEQTSLEFIVNGLPYINVTTNNTVIADGIHYIVSGLPYYATTSPYDPALPSFNPSQFFMLF